MPYEARFVRRASTGAGSSGVTVRGAFRAAAGSSRAIK